MKHLLFITQSQFTFVGSEEVWKYPWVEYSNRLSGKREVANKKSWVSLVFSPIFGDYSLRELISV